MRDGVRRSQAADDGDPSGGVVGSVWIGSAGTQAFRALDDLEPVAPMDKVDPLGVVSVLSPEPLPGEHHNSFYVPPYRSPDPFPVVAGPNCTCEMPAQLPPTAQQMEWAQEVAKQLRIRPSQLPKPLPAVGITRCNCSGERVGSPPHDWSKLEAVPGTRKFAIVPADSTYPDGDYWSPSPLGGVIAPADVMPSGDYPVQARPDRIYPLPATAQEDRIGLKFARYMDQVEARSVQCAGDGVSERCVTPCRPGDQVEADFGLRRVTDVLVISTHVTGALVIQFKLPFAQGFLGSVPCPLEASCSAFRACRQANSFCVERESVHSRDYLGSLKLSLKCPVGTKPCAFVQQVVLGKYLRKDGKLCKASESLVSVG